MTTIFYIGSAVIVYIAVPWLYGRWSRWRLQHWARTQGVICLTFDDGPGTRLTPPLLDMLGEHAIRASFFVLGRNVAGREGILRRIVKEGHDVCSHGFSHLHGWKVWPWQSIRDIRRGWQALDAALGREQGTYPFRPPYGKLNLPTMLYLWAKRVPIIYWTTETGDTLSPDRREKKAEQQWGKMQRGAVVLMHDFDRITDHADGFVLQTAQQCIRFARESHLNIHSVSEFNSVTR